MAQFTSHKHDTDPAWSKRLLSIRTTSGNARQTRSPENHVIRSYDESRTACIGVRNCCEDTRSSIAVVRPDVCGGVSARRARARKATLFRSISTNRNSATLARDRQQARFSHGAVQGRFATIAKSQATSKRTTHASGDGLFVSHRFLDDGHLPNREDLAGRLNLSCPREPERLSFRTFAPRPDWCRALRSGSSTLTSGGRCAICGRPESQRGRQTLPVPR